MFKRELIKVSFCSQYRAGADRSRDGPRIKGKTVGHGFVEASVEAKDQGQGRRMPFEPFVQFEWPKGQMDCALRPMVWAMGLTYADHVRETGERAGAPVVFAKPCQPTVNPGCVPMPSTAALADVLQRLDPQGSRRWLQRVPEVPVLLDYEVEVGLRLLEDWPLAAQARMPALGFFLANDVTARSVQIAGLGAASPLSFWSASKGLEGFLPVTDSLWCPDQVNPDQWPDITISTRVNGQLRQQAALRSMLYSPLRLLQLVAAQAPGGILHRDDLVLTGTPAGIALQVPGWKRKLAACLPRHVAVTAAWRSQSASGRFLQVGDVIEMQADWLGQLQLTVGSSS